MTRNRTSASDPLGGLDIPPGMGMEEVSDRDLALGMLLIPADAEDPHVLDYESQLLAMRALLTRNLEQEAEALRTVHALGEAAREHGSERAIDDWIDHLHDSVYMDAVHSMAAVGLIAPFTESVFVQLFRYIEREIGHNDSPPTKHERWQHANKNQWDCRFVLKGKRYSKDVVKGIMQMADALDVTPHLPSDLEQTLSALFAYRNKMFHGGLEWPPEARRRFGKQMGHNNWTGWFSKAESGGTPWIFYMSSEFVEYCLDTMDRIVDGMGAYCRTTL